MSEQSDKPDEALHGAVPIEGLNAPDTDAKSASLDIKSYILRLSREPFQDILADVIGARPTIERLKQFASENPDKWASMIKTFAGLAGYKEEIEFTNTFIFRLQNMSDAELLIELDKNRVTLELDADPAPEEAVAVAIEYDDDKEKGVSTDPPR